MQDFSLGGVLARGSGYGRPPAGSRGPAGSLKSHEKRCILGEKLSIFDALRLFSIAQLMNTFIQQKAKRQTEHNRQNIYKT